MLSDRKGRRWILVLGSLGLPPILFTFALTANPDYLISVAVLGGMAESGFLSTVNATIADWTPYGGRDAAFSMSFIFGTVSSGVGSSLPFAFPYLESAFGVSSAAMHRDFLLLFGTVGLIAPLAFLRLLKDNKAGVSSAGTKPWRRRNLGPLLRFTGANSLIGLGAGFIIPLIPTWFLLKFGVQDAYSGPLLALASLTMGLAALLSPWMSRRLGIVKAIVINQGLSTIFMFWLAFVGDPILAAGLYVVRAAVMNAASPLSDSFLMRIVSPEERGFASSLNSVIWRLPNSVTTIIGGILLASGNYTLPFLLAGGFYLTSIGLFYSFFKDRRQEN